MDNWIRRFRSAEPVDTNQPVLVPGDPERLEEIDRKKNGIPLNEKVVQDLESLSKGHDIRFLNFLK
jgi:LDH2 family malate/lactate/ureidoglycolate dehydrogenase